MKLFDIFDENGEKIGEGYETPSDDGGCGCFGVFCVIIFALLLFGGGIGSWYIFIHDGFYKEYLIQVIITMVSVGVSSFICVLRFKKVIRSILLSILVGGITLGLLISLTEESFFAAFLLGVWISMLPALLFVFLFKLLIACFKSEQGNDRDSSSQ